MKALITGASSGIGREFALELGKMGYDLIITARRIDRLNELKKEIKNVSVTVCECDISDEKQCISLYEKFPDADILINNAGFGVFGDFSDTSLDDELNMINVNIKAVHILTKLYSKEMEKRGKGYILNVASSAAFFPGPMFSSYYASKSYVYRLTLAINEEMHKKGKDIYVGVLCPGPVTTEFNQVAGVKFAISSVTAEYTAKYTIKKMLKKKTVIIPSFPIKCTKLLSKIVPDKLAAKVVFKIQKSKSGNN